MENGRETAVTGWGDERLVVRVALWLWTVVEIAVSVAVFVALAASIAGFVSLPVSGAVQTVALLVFGVQLLVPVWIYYDLRKRGGDTFWLVVAVMPVVNIFGFVAYVYERESEEG